jgi:hypothetical protein
MENDFFKIKLKDNNIIVHTKTNNKTSINFVGYNSTFRYREKDVFKNPNCWVSIPIPSEVLILYITINDNVFFHYKVDGNNITDITHKINFNFNLPITFFTGYQGGGTSVVVKLLKYLGIYFGDDSGDITNRKTHESISMMSILDDINEDLPILVFRDRFNSVMSLYNYKEDTINCTKRPSMGAPLNLIKLGEIFPNSKFVSVIRKPNNFKSTSEGNNFNNASNESILLGQRPLVEGNPLFHLDFYKFFADYTYVNKLLKFLNCNNLLSSQKDLEYLKTLINFNNKALE